MDAQFIFIFLLTLLASGIGAVAGFGTSTIMVPSMLIFFPLPETLLFVGIVHWFGNIWKMLLFREGLRWRLILAAGIPGTIASFIGASLSLNMSKELMLKVLGVVLICYVLLLQFRPCCKIPEKDSTAIAGGTSYGFLAGLLGIGGEVRSAFLSAFDLDKAVYIATAGAIALIIDSSRIVAYMAGGTSLSPVMLSGLLAFVLASFMGSVAGRKVVNRIPQERFRTVVSGFIFLAGMRLALFS